MWGIVSVLVIAKSRWEQQQRRRTNWILMMLLFGPLAVLLFYGTVRQQLLRPERYEMIDGVAEVDRQQLKAFPFRAHSAAHCRCGHSLRP